MTKLTSLLLPLSLIVVTVSTMPAFAQTAPVSEEEEEATRIAKEHYKAGLEAYKAGKYDAAIKELKTAYLLKRLPPLLLNIAATYRKLGDRPQALHFYRKYLQEAPAGAKERPEAENAVAELEKEKEAEEPAAVSESGELEHEIIDEAPPGLPLDIRARAPKGKGVQLQLFYRKAGETDFRTVDMRPWRKERLGRIPAEMLAGKAIQYYIEAKDGAGKVLSSIGSVEDPNVVFVDPSAKPQMVSVADDGTATAKGKFSSLDEENALAAKRRRTVTHSGNGHSKLFWAGVGTLIGGVVAMSIGGAGLGLAANRADVVANGSRDAGSRHYFFNNDPSILGPGGVKLTKEFADFESEGKTFNAMGIAMMSIGGVAAAAGAVIMIVDQTVLRKRVVEAKRVFDWSLSPVIGAGNMGVTSAFTF